MDSSVEKNYEEEADPGVDESSVGFLPPIPEEGAIAASSPEVNYKGIRSASVCTATLHILINPNDEKRPSVVKPTPKKGWRRYLGVGYTILAVNMLALTNTIMKKYSHIHPFNVCIFYTPVALLICLGFILHTKFWDKLPLLNGILPLKDNWKNVTLTLFRGILMSVIFYLSVAAFRYITAADLRTVISSVVIAVFIFGWMFLGEKCGVVPTLIAGVALCGIVIMTRPPMLTGAEEFDTGTLIGIGISFGTMVLIAIHLVVIRYLSQVHHGVGNFILLFWGLIQSLILSWAFGVFEMPPQDEIIGLCFSGLFLGLSLAFLVLALQAEEAGVVALVRTSEVIFVFFWQWVIVGTIPDLISIVGATLVISGVITVTLRKWVDTLPKDNPTRKRLRFLLL